jgi:hypothetical protein
MQVRKLKALNHNPLSEELNRFLEQVMAAGHPFPFGGQWIGSSAENPGQLMVVSWPQVSMPQEYQDQREVLLVINDALGASPEVGLVHMTRRGGRLQLFGGSDWEEDFPYPDALSEADLHNQILWMLKRGTWDMACEAERLWALNGRRLWEMRRLAQQLGGNLDYRQVDVQVCSRLAQAMRQTMDTCDRIYDVTQFVNSLDEASRRFLQIEISALRGPLVSAAH